MLILAACSMIPEFFILLGYGMLASTASHWATQERYAVMAERIAGTLVTGAGIMVALVGLTQNRPSCVAAPRRTKVLSSSPRLAGTILRKS
ncbi:hypothetical protein ACO0K9_16095 [Undibacterium sp. Ji50W]|uniref:hypothetical protein n=1 Tax=Undibacterium sp. Ji50W TaxID=3413041 RepID=UPI003BEFB077